MQRRTVGLLALPALAQPALTPARAQTAARVALLHMNDFHSRHLPIAGNSAACREGAACYGGSARLAAAVAEGRAAAASAGRPALLLDGGDQFMGSLFYTHHRGLAEAAVQRAIGTSAMAVGNHEFDNGPRTLAAYADAAPFPLLSANMDTSRSADLAGRVRPSAEFALGGARLVVIGLTTPDTANISSPGPDIRFSDPAEAAERAIWEARRTGPSTVVLLSHLGLAADRRLAENLRGVDVILGGHSHTLLANGPGGAGVAPEAAGPHPVLARGVRIAQAGAHGRYLGRLDLDISADGHVVAHGGEVRELQADLPEDPAVAALIAMLGEPLEALRGRPVAQLPRALDNAPCGVSPCEIGALVAQGMRRAIPDAQIGWMNGGGIRAGLPAGSVTWGDVLTTLPFQNTVARMVLRGHAIQAALENGVARWPMVSGRFPQLVGLRFTLVQGAPPGSRVAGVEVEEGGSWRALDPGRAYVVATNNFLRRGGDGFVMFRDDALEYYDQGPAVEEALVGWLTASR
jgi:5'-nucleotidase